MPHIRMTILTIAMSLSSVAYAQAEPAGRESSLDGGDRWGHFEVSMGFFGGQQQYGESGFALDSGSADAPPEILLGAPFDRAQVLGLRYDVRLVVNYIRMTAGIDFPFTSFSSSDAMAETGFGVRRVDSLKSYALRFGIGAEYPIGVVAPFVDLLGAVHWINADVVWNGGNLEYSATDFGFSARAGARLQVRDWFFASLAGEVGIIGPVRWSVELSVGFALGPVD